MRKISAHIMLFIITGLLSFFPALVRAQCVPPSMYFELPELFSGTAGRINAVYKFNAVIAGVDAYITITDIVGGATLSSIDDNVFGYPAAWQPVVKTPSVQAISDSYISFKVEFKNSADSMPYVFPCFVMSCIDVDGDNDRVREFVAANGHDSYSVSNTTTLTVTNEGGGLIKAAGSFNNYPGIDTSAYVTNMNFNYSNTQTIYEVRIGNITAESFHDQNRYSCIYFKPISMSNYYVLPSNFINLNSKPTQNGVLLSWSTPATQEISSFQVERSGDGRVFTRIASQSEKNFSDTKLDYYSISYNNVAAEGSGIVYYRVKQIFPGNLFLLSNQIMVKVQKTDPLPLSVNFSPNPFTESVHLKFTTITEGKGEARILNLTTGSEVIKQSFPVRQGINITSLKNLPNLLPGVYAVQVFIDGVYVANQKIVKSK